MFCSVFYGVEKLPVVSNCSKFSRNPEFVAFHSLNQVASVASVKLIKLFGSSGKAVERLCLAKIEIPLSKRTNYF